MNGKIYKITNTITGESYIGQTINSIEDRFKQHKAGIHQSKKSVSKLQQAMVNYGVNNFKVTLIEEDINTMSELSAKETYYIIKYETKDEYNANYGGGPKLNRAPRRLSKLMKDNESVVLLSDFMELENINLKSNEIDLLILFFFKLKCQTCVTISFDEIKELFNSKNLFSGQIVDLFNKLKSKVVNLDLFSKLIINEKLQFIEICTQDEKQNITNPTSTQKYFSFKYSEFRELNGKYSKLLYLLLTENNKYLLIKKEELISKLDVPESYTVNSKVFNDKVLKSAIDKVSKYINGLEVEKVKVGRKITSYKFTY